MGYPRREHAFRETAVAVGLDESTLSVVSEDLDGPLLYRDEVLFSVGIEIQEIAGPFDLLRRDAPVVLDPDETTVDMLEEPALYARIEVVSMKRGPLPARPWGSSPMPESHMYRELRCGSQRSTMTQHSSTSVTDAWQHRRLRHRDAAQQGACDRCDVVCRAREGGTPIRRRHAARHVDLGLRPADRDRPSARGVDSDARHPQALEPQSRQRGRRGRRRGQPPRRGGAGRTRQCAAGDRPLRSREAVRREDGIRQFAVVTRG